VMISNFTKYKSAVDAID